jgi:hypothetical protein
VRARGKRTAYTSVSLHPDAIRDFGNTLYQVKRPKLEDDGHALVQHGGLLAELRKAAAKESKGERLRAVQALRYAKRRREGLIDWKFDVSAVKPTDLVSWAQSRVAAYFAKKA